MSLDVQQVGDALLDALRAALKDEWPAVKDYAEAQAKALAQTLAQIAAMRASGEINDVQARLQLNMQRHASEAALLGAEGLGEVAAQRAINGALAAVKSVVNGAIGFALL